MRAYRSLMVVLLAYACHAATPPSADVASIVRSNGNAVWRVDADGCGWHTEGTAFAIDAHHLVTNHHVIANDSAPTIDGRDGHKISGRVIGTASTPDVAVIEVKESLATTVQFAETSALAEREPIVVLGYPAPKQMFTASSGHILNFEAATHDREAALSDAPINHGSSGGPALRSDGTVAGVVTLMALRTQPADQVAILFTHDAVRQQIDAAIAHPQKVLSTCGLGPDYVPPVPKTFTIKEAPTPAPQPTILATPTASPTYAPTPTVPTATTPTSAPAPTEVPCPSGNVQTTVTGFTAQPVEDQPGTWTVNVEGFVKNGTSRNVNVDHVYVRVTTDHYVFFDAGEAGIAPSGRFLSWHTGDKVVTSENEPTDAYARAHWFWPDPDVASCPEPTPTV